MGGQSACGLCGLTAPPAYNRPVRTALASLVVLLGLSAPTLAATPTPAPPLAGTGLAAGTHVSLASFSRRPVVVDLWASWCGGCIHEAPTLARFSRAHPRVAVLGIDTMDSRAPALAFARSYGLGFPSIFDPHGWLFVRLHSPGLPATLFLDRRHRIVRGIAGVASRAQLESGLRVAQRAA